MYQQDQDQIFRPDTPKSKTIEIKPLSKSDEPRDLFSGKIFEEKKKPGLKKNKTLDKLDRLEIMPLTSSHKLRFEKMHSPSNLFNTFSPTHFSPKNISPMKKKISRFATNNIISLKPILASETEPHLTQVPSEMTEDLKAFLLKSFTKHFIFGFMDEGILNNILGSMKCFELSSGQTLMQKGMTSEFVYIIEKGEVRSLQDSATNETLNVYKNGDLLFDDLFFNNQPSTRKYISSDNSRLWGLPNSKIAQIIIQITEKKYNENREFIDPIQIFAKLTEEQKNSLAENMKNLRFKKGATIIEEDHSGMNFYILKEGLLIKKAKDHFLHYLNPGDCFGENVFLKKNRTYTVVVESDSAVCLSIKREKVIDLFEDEFEKVVFKNLVRSALKNSRKLSSLTSMHTELLISLIKYKTFSKDEKFIPEKTREKYLLYILLDGKLESFNGKSEYGEGFIIGEEYIEDREINLPLFFAKEDCVMAELDLIEFEAELCMSLKEALEKSNNSHERRILTQKKLDVAAQSTLTRKVSPEEVFVLKILGEGFTGIVLLVEYENQLYALKIISKGWIIENELEDYIRNEKDIYLFIDFEFITRLCYTFKDDLSIYFMMEFVNGIEFFNVLCRHNPLSSEEAKFYIATLILCLQYLHDKGIIHRDLKPENIILDSSGYMKLCDLGIAKLMPSNTSRTYTLLGTKLYIAPEMILGKGYSFPVDFWSLGICLYEFVCGDVPFGAQEEEPQKIYESIVLDQLKFPSFVKEKRTKDLIKALLHKSPEKRLGKSFGELKRHPFFADFNWDDLMNRKLLPPYIPTEKDLTLKSGELEKLRVTQNNLSKLLMTPDVVKVKEMTLKVKSDIANWDDVF